MVYQHGEAAHRYDEELRSKGVVVRVVRGLEVEEDEVKGCVRGDDEEDFHHSVVDGDEGRDEVKVAGSEHQREKKLSLSRYPYNMRLNNTRPARLPHMPDYTHQRKTCFAIFLPAKLRWLVSETSLRRV